VSWSKVGETGFATGVGDTHVVSLPGSPVAGDFVLVVLACDATADPSDATTVITSGYTQLLRTGSNAPTNYVGYKVLSGTPDTEVEVREHVDTLSCGLIQIWRGVDTASPLDVTPPAAATGTTGTPNPPSITPATANALVVAIGLLDDDDVAGSVTAPSGYGDLIAADTGQGSVDGSTVMVASKVLATPAAEDPAAFGGGNDAWIGFTIALRLAVGSLLLRHRAMDHMLVR